MSGARVSRRGRARELRDMGVPFLLRQKLARTYVQGFQDREALERFGFTCESFHGCECCSPYISETWVKEGLVISTYWGKIDGTNRPRKCP